MIIDPQPDQPKRPTAQIEHIATYIQVSKEFMRTTEAHDWIYDKLTATLHGSVLTASHEQGEISVYVPPPSFFDWLFKRSKTITKGYEIRQLMKHPPIPDALPIIQFGDQKIEYESSSIDPLIL